jgi:hypothetical protein
MSSWFVKVTILLVIFRFEKPIEIIRSKTMVASKYCVVKYDQTGSNCLGILNKSWKDYVTLLLTQYWDQVQRRRSMTMAIVITTAHAWNK